MITMTTSCRTHFMAMAIYKKTTGDDFKSLKTDGLQSIQPLEVRDGKYTCYVVGISINIQ